MDATCSGLQVLSILMRDENTAKKVNVLPSTEPQDIYSAVAEKVKAEVERKAQEDHEKLIVGCNLVLQERL